MASFHVFVEGATDASPGAIERLATAIASHYGLPAADLLPRLQRGRFRVKGNADHATAEAYARDLTRLGARAVIEEANADNSGRATPLPFPAVRPETPPAGTPVIAAPAPSTTKPPPMSALPPASPSTTKPPPMSALPPASPSTTKPPPIASGLSAAGDMATKPAPAPASGLASGLSAAFSGEVPAADLGALSSDANIALSSLDGVEDNREVGGSIGPAGAPGKPAAEGTTGTGDSPLDLFAPPEAMQDMKVSLDVADEASMRKRASVPPPVEGTDASSSTPAAAPPPQRKSQPSLQPPNVPAAVIAPVTAVPSKLGPLGDERVRFAAGVILAVLLGFVPAHFIAKSKEESSAAEVDRKVIAAQQAADTPETYANLDRMRADQLTRKQDEKRNAAIMGFAIWALVGGGIAFAWFRKIPWDDFA